MRKLTITLALMLLLGTAIAGAAALMHPMLTGEADAQLRMIADTGGWRAIHLSMLAGYALIIAGLWTRALSEGPTRPAILAALAIISVGLAVNALNISFMAGSGWRMAERFAAGDRSVAQIFDLTHPIGLMAARFGNLIVALGAIVLGAAEWKDPTQPRWLAWLAWAAAAGGIVGVTLFGEATREILAAVALLSGWQVATAFLALRQAAESA